MIKVCQKKNCYEPSISRGKYCEQHRTNKAKIKPNNNILNHEEKKEELIPVNINNYDEDINIALKLSLETLNNERQYMKNINQEKINEDRELRREQEYEFNEAMRMDKENHEIEIKRIIIKENEPIESEKYFNIKIKLPNITLRRKFKFNANLKDIRDYLDVYFEDNNINIKTYNLVINQSPLRKLLIEDNNILIESLKLSNSFILFLENLDA